MNKDLKKNLINQFFFVIESDAAVDICEYFDRWKKETGKDYFSLAPLMVQAFEELVFGLAEDLEKEDTKVCTETEIISLFNR